MRHVQDDQIVPGVEHGEYRVNVTDNDDVERYDQSDGGQQARGKHTHDQHILGGKDEAGQGVGSQHTKDQAEDSGRAGDDEGVAQRGQEERARGIGGVEHGGIVFKSRGTGQPLDGNLVEFGLRRDAGDEQPGEGGPSPDHDQHHQRVQYHP